MNCTRNLFYIQIFLLYFFASFSSKVLKILKETVLLSIPEGDAILIPTIKLYMSLPFTLAALAFFNWLSNRYSQRMVLTLAISLMSGWFLLFGIGIYPSYESLSLVQTGIFLHSILPTLFAPIIPLITYWGPTLFYCIGDLFPGLIISVLLLSFIADVTTHSQGAFLFPLLSLDFPGITAGLFCSFITNHPFDLCGYSGWQAALLEGILVICGASAMTLVLVWKLPYEATGRVPCQNKFSFRQNLQTLRNHPILLYVAMALFVYEATSELTSVLWKKVVLEQSLQPEIYSSFMGTVTLWTGIFGVFSSLTIIPRLLRSGEKILLIFPIILFVSNALFFIALLAQPFFMLALCTFHVILGDILKFAFFDPAKELALQPLPSQIRRQGKSITDLLGKGFGKAAAPISCQLLMGVGFRLGTFGFPLAILTSLLLGVLWRASRILIKKQVLEES